MDYPYDLIAGEVVPPLVVRDRYVIKGEHKGTVYVETGILSIEGTLHGTLNVKREAEAEISGIHEGPVYIETGSKVSVTGAIEGTTNIEQGGMLVVEEGGVLEGALFNGGSVILRGAFGGAVNGPGEIKVEGVGYIKKPVMRDGFIFFQ